jgi:hypothetical protein
VCNNYHCWSASQLTNSLYVICSLSTFLGKQILHDDIVIGLEEVIDVERREPRRFGTAGPIVNLFRDVWKEEQHVFAAEGKCLGENNGTRELGHPD